MFSVRTYEQSDPIYGYCVGVAYFTQTDETCSHSIQICDTRRPRRNKTGGFFELAIRFTKQPVYMWYFSKTFQLHFC